MYKRPADEQELWKLSEENKILRDNILMLQEQLHNAYKRIAHLNKKNETNK